MRNKWFRILYGILLAIFLLSATALLLRLAALRENREFYQEMSEEEISLPMETEERAQSALSLRFSHAAETYADLALWLQIPQTTVDYPVMLGEDNQFYLQHLPDGSKNGLGTPFLDYRTKADARHLVIYGHNGVDGAIFGALKQFESPEFLSAHPAITLATAEEEFVCPIFSVRRVSAESEAYTLDFETDAAFAAYIAEAAEASIYPIAIAEGDAARIVTLSTCTQRSSERLIVQALLCEGAELK